MTVKETRFHETHGGGGDGGLVGARLATRVSCLLCRLTRSSGEGLHTSATRGMVDGGVLDASDNWSFTFASKQDSNKNEVKKKSMARRGQESKRRRLGRRCGHTWLVLHPKLQPRSAHHQRSATEGGRECDSTVFTHSLQCCNEYNGPNSHSGLTGQKDLTNLEVR